MHKKAFESEKQAYCRQPTSSAFDAETTDLDEYLRLCESGVPPKILMRSGDTREEIKRRLFVVLYGKPKWQSAVGDWFSGRFPTVLAMLTDLKRREYQRAAWTMQHAESSLFIGAVCGRIMREQPTVSVLTIHDSLMTTPVNAGYVESVLNE